MLRPASSTMLVPPSVRGDFGDVELVFDFADQLLEDIFDGDDAGGGAELIDDDGEMALAAS